jgi:hypothetical protein
MHPEWCENPAESFLGSVSVSDHQRAGGREVDASVSQGVG